MRCSFDSIFCSSTSLFSTSVLALFTASESPLPVALVADAAGLAWRFLDLELLLDESLLEDFFFFFLSFFFFFFFFFRRDLDLLLELLLLSELLVLLL